MKNTASVSAEPTTTSTINSLSRAYVLISIGVIIAFLLAAFVVGWFIGRLRQHRRDGRGLRCCAALA